jgi:hypothetical protein
MGLMYMTINNNTNNMLMFIRIKIKHQLLHLLLSHHFLLNKMNKIYHHQDHVDRNLHQLVQQIMNIIILIMKHGHVTWVLVRISNYYFSI